MKVIAIGADISINDVSCSKSLINNIEKDIPNLIDLGASHAALTNITGDDVVISAFAEDDLIETINQGIVDILKDNAEDIGDIAGIAKDIDSAGEGISYGEAKIKQDMYPDAIILAYDTYGGEKFVEDVANSAINAAKSMEGLTDISESLGEKHQKIPGVGFVSSETDDPIVVASVENLESIGIISGAMIGASLGNKNVYLVERNTSCNVIPGSVIVSATAFMNGNVIDLAIPFQNRMQILR
ncbi:MAG: hypothetical protein LBU74_05975 [Methanobacteriaceae archaeon]|nr:hypothetical protein [Candidatus Methanorudis spinitermitis]